MNKLIEVLEVQSYSGKDFQMRKYLYTELKTIEGVGFYDDGDNIYAYKGTGPFPCMVAHMDTVHPIVENLTAITINGKITGMNAVRMEQSGIGGDDKVGIYVALQMLREQPNMKCFFPRDEEIGCVGSSLVEKTFFDDVTLVLQCDRRGNTDFVTNASGVELSSYSFQQEVLPILTQYGYKFSTGMMTDVMQLKEEGINVCMANISCGYYNPHDAAEYVDVADVHKVTLMVSEIITKMGGTFHPHEAPKRKRYDSGNFAWWNDDRSWLDDRIDSTADTRRPKEHEFDNYCVDCYMKPAISTNGLCDDCAAWALEQDEIHARALKRAKAAAIPNVNFASKPDYGQTVRSSSILKKLETSTKMDSNVPKNWKLKKMKKRPK